MDGSKVSNVQITHFILNTGYFLGRWRQLHLKWIFSNCTLDCNHRSSVTQPYWWWYRRQQQLFGYKGLKRQMNECGSLANQRICLAFISFDPASLIRFWLYSKIHPFLSQVQTALNPSLWWGPSKCGAQSPIMNRQSLAQDVTAILLWLGHDWTRW